jgi:hypothetical protein
MVYESLWQIPFQAPFQRIESITGLWMRGETMRRISKTPNLSYGQIPALIPFMIFETPSDVNKIISLLNKVISRADEEIGSPIKAMASMVKLEMIFLELGDDY